MDRFEGKRLNSPNDVVVKSDGSIWFTDPDVRHPGRLRGPQGRARARRPTSIASIPTRARRRVVAEGVLGPNGLVLLAGRERSSTSSRAAACRTARSSPTTSTDGGRKLANKRVHIDAGPGTPDGMRCDIDGNLWCGWGMGSPDLDGVMVFAPDGKPIGRIALPERCANVCFGGLKRNRLFMAASQSVYALYVNTQGAAGG